MNKCHEEHVKNPFVGFAGCIFGENIPSKIRRGVSGMWMVLSIAAVLAGYRGGNMK